MAMRARSLRVIVTEAIGPTLAEQAAAHDRSDAERRMRHGRKDERPVTVIAQIGTMPPLRIGAWRASILYDGR